MRKDPGTELSPENKLVSHHCSFLREGRMTAGFMVQARKLQFTQEPTLMPILT